MILVDIAHCALRGAAQTYEKWSVLSVFGRCGPIPQDFGQVQAQIILCFIKMMRVCFIIAC